MAEIPASIDFTSEEAQLFEIFKETLKRFQSATVVRVAGGWVRDKLLKRESHDIDIALDNQMGLEFANQVVTFIGENPQLASTSHSVNTIGKNPEKSKHLETATTRIDLPTRSYEIDFTNLRTETYTDDSRVPITKFGTPLQDALRRDATINSLFYNVNTGEVEDFTGKGVSDLREGIIRTPLSALETFLDDPLRVLRVIRFSSRFGFRIDADALKYLYDPRVTDMLKRKVTRERVGAEIEGMLRDASVFEKDRPSFGYLGYLTHPVLYDALFGLPAEMNIMCDLGIHKQYPEMCANITQFALRRPNIFTPSIMRLVNLCLLVLPYDGLTYVDTKKKTQTIVSLLLRENIKFPNYDCDTVPHILAHMSDFECVRRRGMYPDLAVDLSIAIYNAGKTWAASLLLGCSLNDGVSGCDMALEVIKHLNLQNVWDLKPILNGKDLQKELGIKGPEVGAKLKLVIDWQLRNPTGTRDDCLTYLRSL